MDLAISYSALAFLIFTTHITYYDVIYNVMWCNAWDSSCDVMWCQVRSWSNSSSNSQALPQWSLHTTSPRLGDWTVPWWLPPAGTWPCPPPPLLGSGSSVPLSHHPRVTATLPCPLSQTGLSQDDPEPCIVSKGTNIRWISHMTASVSGWRLCQCSNTR